MTALWAALKGVAVMGAILAVVAVLFLVLKVAEVLLGPGLAIVVLLTLMGVVLGLSEFRS